MRSLPVLLGTCLVMLSALVPVDAFAQKLRVDYEVRYNCNLSRGSFYQAKKGVFPLSKMEDLPLVLLSGRARVNFSNGFYTFVSISIEDIGRGRFRLGPIDMSTIEDEGVRVIYQTTFSHGYKPSPIYSLGADFVISGGGWDGAIPASGGCVLTLRAAAISSSSSSQMSSTPGDVCIEPECLSAYCVDYPQCVNAGCCGSVSSSSSSSAMSD